MQKPMNRMKKAICRSINDSDPCSRLVIMRAYRRLVVIAYSMYSYQNVTKPVKILYLIFKNALTIQKFKYLLQKVVEHES